MMNCRTAYFLLIVTSFLPRVHAEVAITSRPAPRQINTDAFEAIVGWDGCLTNIKVGGQEFLASGVSISRGGYFYQNGVLQLPEIEQTAPNVVATKSSLASATYEFDDRMIVAKLENRSDEPLVYFFVCSANIKNARDGNGAVANTALTSVTKELTLFQGHSVLHISGVTKVWGPWEGSHQVVEIQLKAGEVKTIKLQFRQATAEENREIAKMFAPPTEAPMTVLSPRNYQVFQRRNQTEGDVLISGRCSSDVDTVELMLTGTSQFGKLPEGWQSIAVVSDVRDFHWRKSLPAGGWYTAKLRSKKAGSIIAEMSVERFGVGEVFVGAGQSNSTNSGELKTQQTSGMVASFGGDQWQLANDPQPGAADQTQGGSFWPAFGDVMYEKHQVPIGVAVTGFGGTSVNQWQPDDELFDWMMKRIYQLGPSGFRALLWHQGESDIEMESNEYYTKLHNIIDKSREHAGWEFPWFVAMASYHNAENSRYDNVRSAQRRLWENGIALEGPDTDTLTGDHRDFGGSGIHLSPKGLKAHGEMWERHVTKYVEEALR